jgi:hypothetical protein
MFALCPCSSGFSGFGRLRAGLFRSPLPLGLRFFGGTGGGLLVIMSPFSRGNDAGCLEFPKVTTGVQSLAERTLS